MRIFAGTVVFLLCGWGTVAHGQAGEVANPSFEAGEKTPKGWNLSKGNGEWLKTGGLENSACVTVEGDGKSDGAWLSDPVTFLPAHVYRFSFNARGEDAGGGTAVSGPAFANVDVGIPGKEWALYENVFAAPFRKDDLTVPLHLGQWQLKGKLFFDDVRLVPVQPVYSAAEGLVLGAGEQVDGNAYSFDAPLASECRNHSRPLAGFTAHFNSDRWCFGEGVAVTYRHALAGRRFLSGALDVSCGYHVSGRLLVDVSPDAKTWQHVGVLTNTGGLKVDLPKALFPAEAVFVRLRGGKAPCSFQVQGYAFHGETDGKPLSLVGSTRYVEEHVKSVNKMKVQVLGLGDAVPGGDNCVDLQLRNLSRAVLPAEARVIFSRPGAASATNALSLKLPAGEAFNVRVPYEIPGTGLWRMSVEVGNAYTAVDSVLISEYYDDSYGELIPVNNPKLNLWRASSGWKIPQRRALPRQIAKALVLRAARNEWEALQLVVAPNVTLSNLTVRASELTMGLGKNKIPAENIQVLRVGYVPVTRKTDRTGTLADWPDPLPPQRQPIGLAAGMNQPYWIRVKVPKDIPAGIYRGAVTVEADGVKASTVLNVEVYDFALPDTLTCSTSFGFSPGTVWRYQRVTDPAQRRDVLDKYLTSLSEHHVSPYNPAPMDKWSVAWTGLNPWQGGTIVTNEKAEGRGSLLVSDPSAKENVCASYEKTVTLPATGFKIAFKHKADKQQKFLFSLNYHRADGTWISGHNTDLAIEGKPEWQSFETTCASFPKEAATCRFSLFAAGYQEPGVATGKLWVDSLSVADAATGKSLVEGGAFEPFDAAKAEPVFDWSAWDAAMTRAFETYHFNSFVMHLDGLGGGTFQERYEPSFLGYAETAPEYDVLFGKYLKGIEAHLKEKGWLDKAYVYWFDEPDPKDYAFVMNGFAKLKKHAPDLRRMLTEQVEKELVGGPNLWVPLTPSLNVAGAAERRTAGDQFWWYVCCGPKAPYATEFIDHSGTEMRVWLWQTWAERVTGVLIWETVWWTSDTAYPDPAKLQNPYLDPMSWVGDGHLAPGTKSAWGNGDGRLMYPPEAAADGHPSAPVLDGPVDSIRFEMLRDGLEDYEYFAILKRLLDEKAPKMDPRMRADCEALLTVPADVSASLTRFTRDPAMIEAHRDRLARAIVELVKAR
jgi:hypothetical protein